MVVAPSAEEVVLISLVEEELGVSIALEEVDLIVTGVLVVFDSEVVVT